MNFVPSSPVSCLNTRTLLLGVIIGLLTPVQSLPIDAVTQTPDKTEDDVFREALTDGFIMEHPFLPSVTTEPSKSNTTVQLPETLYNLTATSGEDTIIDTSSSESDTTEASGALEGSGDLYISPSVWPTRSSTSTSTLTDGDAFISNSDSTQSTPSGFSFTSAPGVEEGEPLVEETTRMVPLSSVAPSQSVFSQHTEPVDFSPNSRLTTLSPSSVTPITLSHNTMSDREEEESFVLGSDTSSSITFSPALSTSPDSTADDHSTTKPGTSLSSSTAAIVPKSIHSSFTDEDGSGSGLSDVLTVMASTKGEETTLTSTPVGKGNVLDLQRQGGKLIVSSNDHVLGEYVQDKAGKENRESASTWLIITGFVVGVAAMVLVSIAIATRNKWNGPSKDSNRENTKDSSSNQQKEMEMEIFLHQEKPKESKYVDDYTVIPLDDLPEKEPLPLEKP